MKTKVIVSSLILIFVVSMGFYLLSPFFINNVVDEPLPIDSISFLNNYSEFMKLDETERLKTAQDMNDNQINNIMVEAAKLNNQVNEDMLTDSTNTSKDSILTGMFTGVDDGIHDASGMAKIIQTSRGEILRFEDFHTTNGPDLYVYLSPTDSNSDIVDLGRLKGNVGNQNYLIPLGTDTTKYDTVLIWCKAFSVLFGSAKLS